MNIVFIAIGVVVVLFIGYVVYMTKKMKNTPDVPNNDKIKVLNDANFSQQTKKGIVLVDFWASWCMPCKMMAPILNEVAESAPADVRIGKLNVEEAQASAQKHKVRSIPTLIVFKEGKEVSRLVGVKNKDFLLKEIAKFQS
jgi:thioredoxin 1